tara:strand:- start:689 stop:1693 length:1005 start_codon:yes stop_codon:yes gene_type:complete
MDIEEIKIDYPISPIKREKSTSYNLKNLEVPLHIGVVVCGEWKSTKLPLEYLILYLNQKQTMFEYQLVSISELVQETTSIYSVGSREDLLLTAILNGALIAYGKLELKHILNNLGTTFIKLLKRKYDVYDEGQCPDFIIFITTSKHVDPNYFQDDGSNGFTIENPCRGAIIMTGHHCRKLAPPTVIEFVFKFMFRISLKLKYPEFKRKQRHYGQKSCLFDCCHDIAQVRYMILHNYICTPCRLELSSEACASILSALDSTNIYGNEIARHPAKISSDLGFNLSLVKGIYKSNYENAVENLSNSFYSRIGSLVAVSIMVLGYYVFEVDSWFINED